MEMTFENYLLIINVIGFVLFGINTLLYTFTEKGQIDAVLTIIALAGGSLGIVMSMLLFSRKAVKDNMMSRVFVFSVLVIQIVIFLWLKGMHGDKLNLAFLSFFAENKELIYYLVIINVITFIVYAFDKWAAIEHRSRIRIVTLLLLAGAGGSIGALTAMYTLRHKTKKDYFTVGVPMILLAQIVVIFFAMNAE